MPSDACNVTSPKREKNLPHSSNSNTEAFGSHIPHVLPKAYAFSLLSDKLTSPLTNIPPAPYHPFFHPPLSFTHKSTHELAHICAPFPTNA